MWHHWHVFEEEIRRRKWATLIRSAWIVFAAFGGSILALHYPVRYFFPASLVSVWTFSVLVTLLLFLLLLLRFWHTYHVRISSEVKSEWLSSIPKIEKLSCYVREGKYYYDKGYSALTDTAIQELDEWQKSAASVIWQELGEDFYHQFYLGSDTGRKIPTQKNEILSWLNERLVRMARMVNTLKEVPIQLTVLEKHNSESSKNSPRYYS